MLHGRAGHNQTVIIIVRERLKRFIELPIMKSMPIKIPGGLPARAILDSERIFALEKPEAERQRVRPLKMVIIGARLTSARRVFTARTEWWNMARHAEY